LLIFIREIARNKFSAKVTYQHGTQYHVLTFLVGTNEFFAGDVDLGASKQEFVEISGMSPA
jgi:hypothetical protein